MTKEQLARVQEARQKLEAKMEDPDWCYIFLNEVADGIKNSVRFMPDSRVPEIIRAVLRSDDARTVFESLSWGTLGEYIRLTEPERSAEHDKGTERIVSADQGQRIDRCASEQTVPLRPERIHKQAASH